MGLFNNLSSDSKTAILNSERNHINFSIFGVGPVSSENITKKLLDPILIWWIITTGNELTLKGGYQEDTLKIFLNDTTDFIAI